MQKNIPELRFPEFKGEWEEKKLNDVAVINPSIAKLPDIFYYIDLDSVNNGIFRPKLEIKKETAPSRAQRIVSKNDILFQTVRPYQQNNLYFDLDGGYVASTGYAQIRANGSSKFLYQYLYNKSFLNKVMIRCTGTSYPAINSNDLKKIKIKLPKMPEQEKIADFLTSVDNWIQNSKKQKENLEKYKKGMMQKIFNQEIRFKDENGKDFPKWNNVMLDQLFEIKAGGDVDKNDFSAIKTNTYKFPIYANALTNKGIYGHTSLPKIKVNSITVTGRGDIGHANAREGGYTPIVRLLVLIPKKNISTYFYECVINNTRIYIESTGVPQLTVPQLSKYKVIDINFQEQQKIAEFLTSVDKVIESKQQQITLAENWKKGLMQKMFI